MANPHPSEVNTSRSVKLPSRREAKHNPEKLNRLPEVSRRTAMPRSSIYLAMKKGTFPRPVRIGERAVAWRESDIQAWIDERTGGDAA